MEIQEVHTFVHTYLLLDNFMQEIVISNWRDL